MTAAHNDHWLARITRAALVVVVIALVSGCDLLTAVAGGAGLACASDQACPSNLVCVEQRCRPAVSAHDAARDDSSSSDALASDSARADGASQDTRAADASAPDAAVNDTAAHDTAVNDATLRDTTAVRDATTRDAGARDAIRLDRGVATDVSVPADGWSPIDDGGGWDGSVAGHNVVFVSSTSYTPEQLGGAAGADVICQGLASGASLPGTFVAWISSGNVSAISRLGLARGFVRPDGLPFADTVENIAAQDILYPLRVDENGTDIGFDSVEYGPLVLTGTSGSGQVARTCQDWTRFSTDNDYTNGWACGGGAGWSNSGLATCANPGHLYCFETDHAQPLFYATPGGRRAFVSTTTWTPGGGIDSANLVCANNAAAAHLIGRFGALLATADASAASRFAVDGPPWRLANGVLVAKTAADLLAGRWSAPIDRQVDDTLVASELVKTGAATPDQPGAAGATCDDWTSNTAGSAIAGLVGISNDFGFGYVPMPCGTASRLYCLEQ